MAKQKTSWKFWEKKNDKGGNAIEDLGLKIYSDRVLQYRISMIYLLHLAVEGGTLDLPTYLKDEADENEKNIETIKLIRKLMASGKLPDKMKAINLQVTFLDFIMRTVAIPWLRAGDSRAYAKIVNGWEGLYSKSKSLVDSVEYVVNLDKEEGGVAQRFIDKSALVKNLKNFLTVVTFRYGLLITNVSYRDVDVRPSHIAIISQGGRGTFPGFEDPIGAELWRQRHREPA